MASRARTAASALFATADAGAAALAGPAQAATPSTAVAAAWAPADTAQIHPGVMMYTEGAQCTANFVFTDGSSTYLGQAAHCSGTGEATDTNGCEAGVLPIGTQVKIEDAANPGSFPVTGTLAYSSWNAMQAAGETDADACAYNDLGLIKLPAGTSVRSSRSEGRCWRG